ncbi:uncharacterized protein LOC110442161 [Mizuhopecten yessoensis]|uniref:uncharacterized protein LOC110442161 n=1 Tax=Mizuhopecten yessoensis TaxID=6573 RepID=UPI000B458369|nr:uncharacterized protein LOC110442161 [Mizuhopecten yessoensis]
MAKCSFRQFTFLLFNFLFLCLGLGLVGFVVWTLATIPAANEFISGTHVITLTSFCLGFVIVIIGGIGCAAGFCKGLCMLKTYVGLMVTLLFLELGLVFFIYSEQSQIPSVMVDSWDGLNTDTQYQIQTELKCCGIQNYTEYGTDVESYPSSCFVVYDVTGIIEKTVDNLFTMSCLTQMQTWLNDHIPIWSSVILVIAVIESLGGLTSCIFLQRVQKKLKVKPNEDDDTQNIDKKMVVMETGSSKEKDFVDTEHEKDDKGINVPGLIIVSPASGQDIKDNAYNDYLNEKNDDSSSTKTNNEVKDENKFDTASNPSAEGSSLLLIASISDEEKYIEKSKDGVPEDEVETIVLTQIGQSDITNDSKDEKEDYVSNNSASNQSSLLVESVTKDEAVVTMPTTTAPVPDEVETITLDQMTPYDDNDDNNDHKNDDTTSNRSGSDHTMPQDACALNRETYADKEPDAFEETDDIETVALTQDTNFDVKGNR